MPISHHNPDTATVVTLKQYQDEGMPGPHNFEFRLESVGEVLEGGIKVQVLAMSADPYMRMFLKSKGNKLDANRPNLDLGSPISGFWSGKVLESKNPEFQAGDLVGGQGPLATVQIIADTSGLRKLTDLVDEDSISHGIGVLGMPGSTAYGGLVDVLACEKGQTVFVSAAAGAVGSLVGQIAKHVYGCTVIGSAGGPEKCKLITEKYGFDYAIDYKTVSNEEELAAKIREVAPNGIDMYFENVGGMHFEAALATLRPKGRVAVCGAISSYNSATPDYSKINVGNLIYNQQRIEGFVCHQWLFGQKGDFLTDMARWTKEHNFYIQETFYDGIESYGEAFESLFSGKNLGKVVVRC